MYPIKNDTTLFLSTPSGWRATILRHNRDKSFPFLSTPSGWRATEHFFNRFAKVKISIHALRVEGDAITYILRHCVFISIHALRVEGDQACLTVIL